MRAATSTSQPTPTILLVNVAAGVALGGTAGVSAVAVVTYFQGNTTAEILDNAHIGSDAEKIGGGVKVAATSSELVTADAAGLSGGGVAGVGGTLDVIITKLHTTAKTGDKVEIYAKGDVDVTAADTYDLVAVVATAAAGGTAGVGVTGLVSVSLGDVAAVIGNSNTVKAANVNVKANEDREVIDGAATIAGGGVAGVGATITVVVAGSKMSAGFSRYTVRNAHGRWCYL